jgi:hypothetical protein
MKMISLFFCEYLDTAFLFLCNRIRGCSTSGKLKSLCGRSISESPKLIIFGHCLFCLFGCLRFLSLFTRYDMIGSPGKYGWALVQLSHAAWRLEGLLKVQAQMMRHMSKVIRNSFVTLPQSHGLRVTRLSKGSRDKQEECCSSGDTIEGHL